jgi:hypothetical protein
MVRYSTSITALLSVVGILGANASARVKNGRDAGGKEHRRKLVGYSDKIVEDWTDDGWHADGWEKPILCEKPEVRRNIEFTCSFESYALLSTGSSRLIESKNSSQ